MWFPSQWQLNGPDVLILCIWGKWTVYTQTTSAPINTAHQDRCEAFLLMSNERFCSNESACTLNLSLFALFVWQASLGILEWVLIWIIWRIVFFSQLLVIEERGQEIRSWINRIDSEGTVRLKTCSVHMSTTCFNMNCNTLLFLFFSLCHF